MRSLALVFTVVLLSMTTAVAETYYHVTGIALTDTLNVRSQASVNADKAGVLAADAKCIRVQQCKKGWCLIDFEQGQAYVYQRYLKKMQDSSSCQKINSGLPTLEEVAALRAKLDAKSDAEMLSLARAKLMELSTSDYLIEITRNMCGRRLLDQQQAVGIFISAAHRLFASYQTAIADNHTNATTPLVRITTNSAKGQVIADYFGEHDKLAACRVVMRHADGYETDISHSVDHAVARFMRMGGRFLVARETHQQESLADEAPYQIDLNYYGVSCDDIYLKTITAKQAQSVTSSALEIAISGSLQAPKSSCLPFDEMR